MMMIILMPKDGGKISKQVPRGPRYTQNKDLIICQSFMAASENSIVGTSQKGKAFVDKMYEFYIEKMEKCDLGGRSKPLDIPKTFTKGL
jgi:hypothetical protein